jgi:hypothetical protein
VKPPMLRRKIAGTRRKFRRKPSQKRRFPLPPAPAAGKPPRHAENSAKPCSGSGGNNPKEPLGGLRKIVGAPPKDRRCSAEKNREETGQK